MMKTYILCAALVAACWCGATGAQTALARTALAQQPQAAQQPDTDPTALTQWGLQVLGVIDSQQIGVLWDRASQVAKQTVRRHEFVAKVAEARKSLRISTSHVWIAVQRQVVTQQTQGVPPGLYATVEFASTFQNNKTIVEVVSLRRDEDGRWRFAGYFTR